MNLFRNRLLAIGLPLTLSAGLPAAQAQTGLNTQLALGQLGYTIESSARQLWEGSAKAVTFGVDYALPNGFYLGLGHTQALSGELDFSFQGARRNTSDFKRSDTALTLGWSAANRLNTFVGLKSAASKIDNSVATEFKTTGYFVGLSYPLSFGSSYLSLSAAVGLNSGSWKDTSGPTIKDTAVGYSGGIKYSYAINPSMVLGLGLKAQRYSYDFTQLGFGTVDESVRLVDLSFSFAF